MNQRVLDCKHIFVSIGKVDIIDFLGVLRVDEHPLSGLTPTHVSIDQVLITRLNLLTQP